MPIIDNVLERIEGLKDLIGDLTAESINKLLTTLNTVTSTEFDKTEKNKLNALIEYINQLKAEEGTGPSDPQRPNIFKTKEYKAEQLASDLFKTNNGLEYNNFFSVLSIYINLWNIWNRKNNSSNNNLNYRSSPPIRLTPHTLMTMRKGSITADVGIVDNNPEGLKNSFDEALAIFKENIDMFKNTGSNDNYDFIKYYCLYNIEVKKCHLYSLYNDFFTENNRILNEEIKDLHASSPSDSLVTLKGKIDGDFAELFDSDNDLYAESEQDNAGNKINNWFDMLPTDRDKKSTLTSNKLSIIWSITNLKDIINTASSNGINDRECRVFNNAKNQADDLFKVADKDKKYNSTDFPVTTEGHTKNCNVNITTYSNENKLNAIVNKMMCNYENLIILDKRLDTIISELPGKLQNIGISPDFITEIEKLRDEITNIKEKELTNKKMLADEKFEYNKNILRMLIYLTGIIFIIYLIYNKTKKIT